MAQDLIRRPEPPREVHPVRFKLAYAALAVVLGAAVGTLIVLLGRGSNTPSSDWSAWRPDGGESQRTKQIAQFVSRQYRLPSGRQLVAVFPGPPRVGEVPIEHVALALGNSPSDISVYGTSNSVIYQLCGLGRNCAIEEGAPSVDRGHLLRREALELSLYTFKYADADSVVTLLPGAAGTNNRFALYLRRDDFENALDRPLNRTLRPRAEIEPGQLNPRENKLIQDIELRHLFQYSFQQAPDGSAILILAEPPS